MFSGDAGEDEYSRENEDLARRMRIRQKEKESGRENENKAGGMRIRQGEDY